METPLSSTSPLPCCSFRSKLICFSAGLVILIVVAIVSFFLGRTSVKSSPLSQALPTPTIAVSPTSIPTPDETVNWQVYRNEKYGFEFKYPNDYKLSDKPLKEVSENRDVSASLFIIKKINEEVGQPPIIYLGITNTTKSPQEFIDYDHAREIKDWQELVKAQGIDWKKPSINSIQDIQLNSIQAKKVDRERIPSAPYSTETQYLFKKNNLLYILSVNYGTYNPDTKEAGMDEYKTCGLIFSTFKFLD